jgi:hypothetical protein
MAINKNHEFEDLDGVKCAIVERNVTPERLAFLKSILTFNNYTLVVVPSPPPKTAPPDAATGTTVADAAPAPETFTVGVTDVMFNVTNAVFGRLLKTPDGHVVTLAYWEGRETVSRDAIPYYERK